MKVIFLDFDGVINDYMTINEINQYNVEILKRIVNETDAKVVVTSSHKYPYQRNNRDIEYFLNNNYCAKTLKENGIDIIGWTQNIKEKNKEENQREQEILEYLRNHPEITEYLILDDDYIIESIKEHEIFIDLQAGVREKHIVHATKILSGELNFYHDCTEEQLIETSEERLIRMNEIFNKLENNTKNKDDEEER